MKVGRSDSSSGSEEWGDEGWIVDCPCGVTYDDGEEMVECDACRVWVHTACCRVPKGSSTFVCEKCRSKGKKGRGTPANHQLLPLDLSLPPVETSLSSRGAAGESQHADKDRPFLERPDGRTADKFALERAGASFLHVDTPLIDRVHTHGKLGGEDQALDGVNPALRRVWKFQLRVPKMLDMQDQELPPNPVFEVDLLELLRMGSFTERKEPSELQKRALQRQAERQALQERSLAEVRKKQEVLPRLLQTSKQASKLNLRTGGHQKQQLADTLRVGSSGHLNGCSPQAGNSSLGGNDSDSQRRGDADRLENKVKGVDLDDECSRLGPEGSSREQGAKAIHAVQAGSLGSNLVPDSAKINAKPSQVFGALFSIREKVDEHVGRGKDGEGQAQVPSKLLSPQRQEDVKALSEVAVMRPDEGQKDAKAGRNGHFSGSTINYNLKLPKDRQELSEDGGCTKKAVTDSGTAQSSGNKAVAHGTHGKTKSLGLAVAQSSKKSPDEPSSSSSKGRAEKDRKDKNYRSKENLDKQGPSGSQAFRPSSAPISPTQRDKPSSFVKPLPPRSPSFEVTKGEVVRVTEAKPAKSGAKDVQRGKGTRYHAESERDHPSPSNSSSSTSSSRKRQKLDAPSEAASRPRSAPTPNGVKVFSAHEASQKGETTLVGSVGSNGQEHIKKSMLPPPVKPQQPSDSKLAPPFRSNSLPLQRPVPQPGKPLTSTGPLTPSPATKYQKPLPRTLSLPNNHPESKVTAGTRTPVSGPKQGTFAVPGPKPDKLPVHKPSLPIRPVTLPLDKPRQVPPGHYEGEDQQRTSTPSGPSGATQRGSVSVAKGIEGDEERLASMPQAPPLPKAMAAMPPPPPPVAQKRAVLGTESAGPGSSTLRDEELALLLHQELNSSPRMPRNPRTPTVVRHVLGAAGGAAATPAAKRPPSGLSEGGSVTPRDGAGAVAAAVQKQEVKPVIRKRPRSDDRGFARRDGLPTQSSEGTPRQKETLSSGRGFSEGALGKTELSVVVPEPSEHEEATCSESAAGAKRTEGLGEEGMAARLREVVEEVIAQGPDDLSFNDVCRGVEQSLARVPNGVKDHLSGPRLREAMAECLRSSPAGLRLLEATRKEQSKRIHLGTSVSPLQAGEQPRDKGCQNANGSASQDRTGGDAATATEEDEQELTEDGGVTSQGAEDEGGVVDISKVRKRKRSRRVAVEVSEGSHSDDGPKKVTKSRTPRHPREDALPKPRATSSGFAWHAHRGKPEEVRQQGRSGGQESPETDEDAVSNYSEDDEEMVGRRGPGRRDDIEEVRGFEEARAAATALVEKG